MSVLRTTLVGIRNGCRSFRASQASEIENHLTTLRVSAPEAFRASGWEVAIPYLDRMFDGLRDAVLDGQAEAHIDLVDTKADDVAIEAAANVWTYVASYLVQNDLRCDRTWRWHDEGRRSGVVVLIVQI
jgi:hypothetical protein